MCKALVWVWEGGLGIRKTKMAECLAHFCQGSFVGGVVGCVEGRGFFGGDLCIFGEVWRHVFFLKIGLIAPLRELLKT